MTVRSQPLVAFQGELGAFSEDAVHMYFAGTAEPSPCRTFDDVARAVTSGAAEYGLLPIENTTVGAVSAACDVLAASALFIIGEVICPVRHCLLGVPGATLHGLRHAYSHPVALGQCADYFSAHSGIEPVAMYDTAGAARHVAATADPASAAVASRRAAERYGLEVIAEDIQDRSDNQTRFLVVVRSAPVERERAGAWKTALLVETGDRPGALLDVLRPLAAHEINMSHLQSRPGAQPWTYWFFLEVEAAIDDSRLTLALEEIGARASARVLGSFPRHRS
jgi:prephenate dehydratase